MTERCGEHDNPKPCVRCALLCPCGCDNLREGVTEDVWKAGLAVEPFLRAVAMSLIENASAARRAESLAMAPIAPRRVLSAAWRVVTGSNHE